MQSERRREKRIPFKSFPNTMGGVFLKTGLLKKSYAIILDASKEGMSLLVFNIKKKHIKTRHNIIIDIMPQKFKLKSRIIYVNEIGADALRIGVRFEAASSILESIYIMIKDSFGIPLHAYGNELEKYRRLLSVSAPF